MPRAANSGTGALRRNQACRQCRKRKLKCDAQRPHCGTCQRQWTAQISVPPPVGYAHPPAPTCTYDPVEGLTLAPDTVEDPADRVRVLEMQIAQLSAKLVAAQNEHVTRTTSPPDSIMSQSRNPESPPSGHLSSGMHNTASGSNSQPGYDGHFDYGLGRNPFSMSGEPSQTPNEPFFGNPNAQNDIRQYPQLNDEYGAPILERPTFYRQPSDAHPYGRDQQHVSMSFKTEKLDSYAGPTIGFSGTSRRSTSPLLQDAAVPSLSRFSRQNEFRARNVSITGIHSEPFMDVMYTGWNRDLPDRQSLVNLVEIFFRCDPCSSRILHKASLLASLMYPPTHPDFPHPALLHAICATASRWTSRGRADSNNSLSVAGSNATPPVRDKFAELHANKTRAYVNQTLSNGQNIFQVFQACIILSWWFYSEGRWVEVWIQAGFQTRAAIPLGMNYLGMIKRGADGAVVRNPYLKPPEGPRELEERRRAWWMALMFDRIVSVGGWLHSVDERDVGTEFPLRMVDFDAELDMAPNPQTLHSESVFIHHPLSHTDSYLLFLKSVMLFGRVTDYCVRMGIRAPLRGYGKNDGSSPTMGGATPNGTPKPSPHMPGGHDDQRNAPGFRALDRLVGVDFINSFPPAFRNCLGVGEVADGSSLDTDLYMAHLVPHAAAITLHSPWINFAEPATCPSVARCMEAARAILDKYYVLRSTSFDITWLHPFATICWYLAAVVQVHLCKRLIEVGDVVNEASCWGEINLLRDALITYGQYSPIGTRQEKMLHPIMKDIIDMTSQEKPLSVGLPLYPFSLETAFARDDKKAGQGDGGLLGARSRNIGGTDPLSADPDTAVAPLPDATYGEDISMVDGPSITVPSLSHGQTSSVAGMWSRR